MSLSDTWDTVRRKGGERGRDILSLTIMLFAVVAMGMVGYGQYITSHINAGQSELLPIADGVANRAAASHLYLIEALGGDTSVDVSKTVFAPLTEAQHLLSVELNGGTDLAGNIVQPTTDPQITKDLTCSASTSMRSRPTRRRDGSTASTAERSVHGRTRNSTRSTRRWWR